MPENELAWQLLMECSTQVIPGPMGPIDLDYRAVHFMMDLMEIPKEERYDCFKKVTKTFKALIKSQENGT